MFRAVIAFEKDCLSKRDLTLSNIGKVYLFSWNTIIPGVLEVVTVKRLNEAEIIYIICVNWSADTNSHSLILPRWSIETSVPKFCCDFWWVVMCSLIKFTQSVCCLQGSGSVLLILGHYSTWEKKPHRYQGGNYISAQLAGAPKTWFTLTTLYTASLSYASSSTSAKRTVNTWSGIQSVQTKLSLQNFYNKSEAVEWAVLLQCLSSPSCGTSVPHC